MQSNQYNFFENICKMLIICLLAFSNSLYAQNLGTGCVLDKKLYDQVPLSAPLMRGDYGNLPEKVSLRKYAPVPQNQGSYGTCVGWSTAYSARTILMSNQKGWSREDWINENALSPFFIYEQAKSVNDVNCQEGTSLVNALEIIKQIGVVRMADFGKNCGQNITTALEKKAGQFKIKEYKRLFETETANKASFVKKSLAENKPVIIGIQCCTESFLNAKGQAFWELKSTDNPNPAGGHALTVIGYDDTLHGGAFELMNSWGSEWGEQGFIWMKYSDFNKYCFEAYEMTPEAEEYQTLSGSMKLVLSAGQTMEAKFKKGYYEMKEPYHSGTLFRLYVSNNEPAYVYAFSSDLSKKNYKIFPQQEGISAYLGYKGNNIAFPNEDQYLQMDNTKGTDYFCVLYSAEKLPIDQILVDLENAEGSFQQRLSKVLGEKMLNPQEVKYTDKDGIGFKGIYKNKKVIPIIVAINHI
jgi:C1A family cysteine protease